MTTKLDAYGIICETHLTLHYPRCVDETAPTLAEALVDAGRMLTEGEEKVSICTTRNGYEVETLITLTAHEYLEEHDSSTGETS